MTEDVSTWLSSQNLSQYRAAFEAHHIDMALLPELTYETLIELGVDSLGHRLKLLKAIESLKPGSPSLHTEGADLQHTRDTTERRQLTVMFCDLVDSTGLAASLDAEDLRHVIKAYQSSAEPVIKRYAGRIAQYLGDGLLVYFGYPNAHEDDAIRAVHAGLDLIGQLQALNTALEASHKVSLSVRIGIHTGPVVMGEIGEADRTELLATGMTPNHAAHLQHLAPTNGVVVSRETRDLLGNTFSLEKSDGEVFGVLGKRLVESRFAASSHTRVSKLIGRDNERALLQQLFEQCASGDGQVMCVSGEAGIGKSRLVKALCDDVQPKAHHRIIYQCSPYHMDSPLYPVQRHMMRAMRSIQDRSEQPVLDDLEQLLSAITPHQQQAAHLLADLVHLRTQADERYGELTGTAQEKRERTLDTLLEQLMTLAHQQPMLVIFEDIQWSDATTLELAHRAMEHINTAPVLMVLTARPDAQPEWCTPPSVQHMSLKRLSPDSLRNIVTQVSDHQRLPHEWINRIVERSDGVPLFAEELTKAMLHKQPVQDKERTVDIQAANDAIHIPTSLHDSLMARLDRMQTAKPIAQMAAVIGREFEYRELAALAQVTDDILWRELSRLQAEEIIESGRTDMQNHYQFRHALLRDAAYESLPRSRRQTLHSNLFDVLLDRASSSSDVLAQHALQAKRFQEAAIQFDTAGLLASGRAAFTEAIAHFEQAVSCTRELADTSENRRIELDARVHQGHASTGLNGFAHPTTVRCNAQARVLLDQVGDSPYRIPVIYGHWVIQHASGQHHKALIDATVLHREMQASDDRIKQMVGHRILGSTRLMRGEFAHAADALLTSAELYDHNDWPLLASQFGMDLGAPLSTSLALAQFCQGQADRAMEQVEGLEARSLEQAHPATMLYALSHLALVHQASRFPQRAHFVAAADQLAAKLGVDSYRGHTLGIKAIWLLDQDDVDGSVNCMNESLAIINKTKTYLYTPWLYASHAYALARQGQFQASGTARNRAIDRMNAGGERWAEVEVLRLCALSDALSAATTETTLDALSKALALADKQGAPGWWLRAAVSQAEVLIAADRHAEANALLAKCQERFANLRPSPEDWQAACDLMDR